MRGRAGCWPRSHSLKRAALQGSREHRGLHSCGVEKKKVSERARVRWGKTPRGARGEKACSSTAACGHHAGHGEVAVLDGQGVAWARHLQRPCCKTGKVAPGNLGQERRGDQGQDTNHKKKTTDRKNEGDARDSSTSTVEPTSCVMERETAGTGFPSQEGSPSKRLLVTEAEDTEADRAVWRAPIPSAVPSTTRKGHGM